MSDTQNGSGELVANPLFTLRTIAEARAKLPQSVWGRYHQGMRGKRGQEVLKKLHQGSQVKLLVQPLGLTTDPEHPLGLEFIWFEIVQLDPVSHRHIGKVCDQGVERAKYHGLSFGMMITFEEKHIFDVRLHRLE